MVKMMSKIREIAKKDDGASVVMWVILSGLIAIAVIGVIIANTFSEKNPSTGNYIKHFSNVNKILTEDEIADAQNKFANGGEIKSEWKPSFDVIGDQWTGNENAEVVVVQYEDFPCPACSAFESSAEKIHKDYADKSVVFIYRNFSIGQTTSTISEAGAQAAYLASDKNMDTFWKMANKIFLGQKCIEGIDKNTCQKALSAYANDLGLDVAKFEDLLANFATNGIQDKLNRDKNLGLESGVNATPTWVITGPNGTEKVSGGNESEMRTKIDKALESTK